MGKYIARSVSVASVPAHNMTHGKKALHTKIQIMEIVTPMYSKVYKVIGPIHNMTHFS